MFIYVLFLFLLPKHIMMVFNFHKSIVFLFVFFIYSNASTQENAIVFGTIQDIENNQLIELATVYIKGTNHAVESNFKGIYHIELAADKEQELIFSRIGYLEASAIVKPMPAGVKRNINIHLVRIKDDLNIVIRESRIQDLGMVREEVTSIKLIPSTTGNLESVLPQIALGTYGGSGGELSSQYNVRGGNYDENLIYVNDFEIFKPQLISNSQQEGLSFPNMDLIRDLSFSSGGFESKYGDKLSSVLDVKYKRPEDFEMSGSISFLGASIHVEGSKKLGENTYNKFRYLVGARYKTTKHLLNSQDIEGEYQPNFSDIQSYLTYDISRSLQLSLLSNFNRSIFDFIPADRETKTGTFNNSVKFKAVYEGEERDKFLNIMNGLSLVYLPEKDRNPFFLKLMGSHNYGREIEAIDIIGAYRLSQIEIGFGENAGKEIAVLGTGVQHRYIRNRLGSQIMNIEHKGGIEFEKIHEDVSKSHFLEWGVKYQNRVFSDNINEWEKLDSAGFSLPLNDQNLLLFSGVKSVNDIKTNEYSAFIQNTYGYNDKDKMELKFNFGVRANYLDLNNELLISPRFKLLYLPKTLSDKISFKLAGGVYYQQPFYREMRRPDGSLNLKLKAQKSLHIVGGMTYDFYWKGLSDKPFKLITEAYYKKLSNLVSYDVDNVRIRYSGENDSEGYVTGIDIRLNGELVRGIESWANLSILRARESINGVQHLRIEEGSLEPVEVNDVPRPSDQLLNFSLFFQDYLPRNDKFKVHVAFSFGSGLKWHREGIDLAYRNSRKFKPYHRIDIGFSYHLWNKSRRKAKPRNLFRFSNDTWLDLEIFNLMDISNEASYTWVRTITTSEYAIPNFLTGRRISLKLKIEL